MPMRSLTHRERRRIMTRGLVRQLASKRKHCSCTGTVVALDSGERRTVQGRSGDGRGDSQGGPMGDGRAIRGAGRKARSAVSCGSGGGERARSNGVMPDGRGGHGLESSSRHVVSLF